MVWVMIMSVARIYGTPGDQIGEYGRQTYPLKLYALIRQSKPGRIRHLRKKQVEYKILNAQHRYPLEVAKITCIYDRYAHRQK